MEFWRLVKRPNRHQNLVVKLMRDLESGYFAVPKSYDVLTAYRTEPLMPSKVTFRARVQHHEQPLTKAFLKKYPEARNDPIALGSFQPSVTRRFTQRQAVLSSQSVPGSHTKQGDPLLVAERELAEPLAAMRRRALGEIAGGASPLEFLQQQEQEQLDAGMQALGAGTPLPQQEMRTR